MKGTEMSLKNGLKKYWPVLILLIYVCLNLILILHHENWRDEAQAWQIAKQLSLSEMFAQLKYEGHPCLWYLVLMPFAKLSLPFSGIGFISLFFMGIAGWLVLIKAPFSVPVRIFLVFGSSFFYYYPVIARSYCLIPPLLAGIAILYPKKEEKPVWYGILLALLTQVHVLTAIFSMFLSAAWLIDTAAKKFRKHYEKEKFCRILAGLGISLMSGLFLVWELGGSTQLNTGIDIHISSTLHSNWNRIELVLQWMYEGVFGSIPEARSWLMVLAAGAVLTVLLFLLSWREALIFAAAAVLHLFVSTYIYLPSNQKTMILVHELLCILWIAFQKNREEKKGFCLCWQLVIAVFSIGSLLGCRQLIWKDISEPYSASKGMAEYIQEQVPEAVPVIAVSDTAATGMAAYLSDRSIWDPLLEQDISFITWDSERSNTLSFEEFIQRVRGRYPDAEEIYLLCGAQSSISDLEIHAAEFQEVFRIDAYTDQESAGLYRLQLPLV